MPCIRYRQKDSDPLCSHIYLIRKAKRKLNVPPLRIVGGPARSVSILCKKQTNMPQKVHEKTFSSATIGSSRSLNAEGPHGSPLDIRHPFQIAPGERSPPCAASA
jgi:hypothetical protein